MFTLNQFQSEKPNFQLLDHLYYVSKIDKMVSYLALHYRVIMSQKMMSRLSKIQIKIRYSILTEAFKNLKHFCILKIIFL